MLRFANFRVRYSKWFENTNNGSKEFAEQCLVWFLRDVNQKTIPLIIKKQSLIDKSNKLNSKLDRISSQPMLSDEEHFVKNRVKFAKRIFPILIFTEVFLNYISTLIIIEGNEEQELLFQVTRWSIAIVLTLGTAATTDELLKNIFSRDIGKTEITLKIQDGELHPTIKAQGPMAIILGLLLEKQVLREKWNVGFAKKRLSLSAKKRGFDFLNRAFWLRKNRFLREKWNVGFARKRLLFSAKKRGFDFLNRALWLRKNSF